MTNNLLWRFERARSSVYCPVYLLSKQQFGQQQVQTVVILRAANLAHFALYPHQIGFSGCLKGFVPFLWSLLCEFVLWFVLPLSLSTESGKNI
ncbi:hypothetical protein [Kingella oralis]|uniref:hypothetical protein n=1 Tax=Kingella oralis TaxID=505 RepID=UPI0034E582B5